MANKIAPISVFVGVGIAIAAFLVVDYFYLTNAGILKVGLTPRW